MITAIVIDQDRIANHFTKAPSMLLTNANGQVIEQAANPAADDGCHGKKALLSFLKARGVQRVIVRNIGERMLSQLLAQDIAVYQTNCGRTPLSDLMRNIGLRQLFEASQGRPSLQYLARHKEGQSCCEHSGSVKGQGCANPEQGPGRHGHGRRCCQRH